MSNWHAVQTSERIRPKRIKLRVDCRTGKLRARDHKEAVRLLHSAQVSGKRQQEMTGSTNRAEKRTYMCEFCRGFHTTSSDNHRAQKVQRGNTST